MSNILAKHDDFLDGLPVFGKAASTTSDLSNLKFSHFSIVGMKKGGPNVVSLYLKS